MDTKEKLNSLLFCLFFCSLGCFACFGLQILGVMPIIASAGVGYVGSYLPKTKAYDHEMAKACIYSGSFATIGGEQICEDLWQVLFLSLILGGFFLVFKSSFRGFGGKLGSLAFCAVVFFLILKGGA